MSLLIRLTEPSGEFFNSVRLFYTTQVGSAFTLECTADKFDTIRWYHNGSEIKASSNHEFLENNQYMEVQKPSVSDAGEYMCIASVGSQNFSRKGVVIISRKLQFACVYQAIAQNVALNHCLNLDKSRLISYSTVKYLLWYFSY